HVREKCDARHLNGSFPKVRPFRRVVNGRSPARDWPGTGRSVGRSMVFTVPPDGAVRGYPGRMITTSRLLAPVDPEAPLLVVATREEAEHLGVDVPVLLTGIGRINATGALAETLARGPLPTSILNVGTAGALRDKGADGGPLTGV